MNDGTDFSLIDFTDNSPPSPSDTNVSDSTPLLHFIDVSGSGSPAAPSPAPDATNSFLDAFGRVAAAAITTTGAVEIARNRATVPVVRPAATARSPLTMSSVGGSGLLLPIAGLALLYLATRK